MTDKTAVTSAPIHSLIARRWSPRAFDLRPVNPTDLLALLEAARWAPSASNQQPWRFVVWRRDTNVRAFNKVFATLAEGNQRWVNQVPVLIGVFADTLNHKNEINRTAAYDTGAAAVSLCLQAEALGLATHQMGGFDKEALRAAFAIPETIQPLTLIAVGYPGKTEQLDADLRVREEAARTREPVGTFAFMDAWQSPYSAV